MENLIIFFARFLYRDIIWILGGSLVLITIAYGADFEEAELAIAELTNAVYFLAAVFSWIVGYVVQDIAGILHITSTSVESKIATNPSNFVKWMYKRFIGSDYCPPSESVDVTHVWFPLKDNSTAEGAYYERLIGLLVVGACIGPASLIAAISILVHAAPQFDTHSIVTSVLLLLLSVFLLVLARIKLLQLLLHTAKKRND